MASFFVIAGFVLVFFLVLILFLAFIAPRNYCVERNILIETDKREVIFNNLSDWHEFIKWDPWSSRDPEMKTTFTGTKGEVGHGYRWEGNKTVGSGEMTILSVVPFERTDSDLHFIKPFETRNKTSFKMMHEPGGYRVSWEMRGAMPIPFNVVGLFRNMEKMIAPDFEKGLAGLREKCLKESGSRS